MFGKDLVNKQLKMLKDIENDEINAEKMDTKNINKSMQVSKIQDVSDDEEKTDALTGGALAKKDMNIFNCLVITTDNTWKSFFDILMLFVSCYNIFGNAYYSAFGKSESWSFFWIDSCVEFLFLLDMIFCFC